MSRSITEPVAIAFGAPILNIAWIIRLEIAGDPIYAWTGLRPLNIPAGFFPDAKLNDTTFEGLANIASIGKIVDSVSGSGAVKLTLPGVRLDDDALRQVVYDKRKWQGLRAYIWVVPVGDNGLLVGPPVRVKTGKMDNMNVEKKRGEGIVSVEIESFATYSQRALMTRYSEQKELDPSDTSQDYVHSLANMTPGIGDKSAASTPPYQYRAGDNMLDIIAGNRYNNSLQNQAY